MAVERNLTRREFLLFAATTITSACLPNRDKLKTQETLPQFRERILTFKEGAIINFVEGVNITVNPENITTLYANPVLGLNKPDNFVGTYYLFEKVFDSSYDEKYASNAIRKFFPYISDRLNQDQGIINAKEFSAVSSIRYSLYSLKSLLQNGLLPSEEEILRSAEPQQALSMLLSLDWFKNTRLALQKKLQLPLESKLITPSERSLIANNLPINVTYISEELLKQTGIQ